LLGSDEGCAAPAGAWKRQRGACVCVVTNKTHVCDVGKRKRGLNFAVCVARSVNQYTACVYFIVKSGGANWNIITPREQITIGTTLAGKTLVHITRSLARAFKSATYCTRIISQARHTLVCVTIDPLLDSAIPRISWETMRVALVI
jgi:hypothetical protein